MASSPYFWLGRRRVYFPCHQINWVREGLPNDYKGRYTLGDKLLQHVAATRCSDKSLRVYWRIFVKIFVAATEFVAATSRTNSVRLDFLRRVAATCRLVCTDRSVLFALL